MSLFGTQQKREPLKGARIEDYALIGDLESAALVSREGSIDWLCWPTFSSPACFAALMGTRDNGFWSICPKGKFRATRRQYQKDSLVLETFLETDSGEICITDFMPPRGDNSDIIRIVDCTRGKVEVRFELSLRFDYGLTIPWVTRAEGVLHAVAGVNMVTLRAECSEDALKQMHGEGMTTAAEFTLKQGQRACFSLTYSSSVAPAPAPVHIAAELKNTQDYWAEWIARFQYDGLYAAEMKRTLITLSAMTYRPTGGVVAAPTTSLPERIGGERNWDYRYCWLRDTSFTLMVLLAAGYTQEAESWRAWLLRAIAGAPDQVQAVYGLGGERHILEWKADWLRGYEDSKPVRIGNAAAGQFQLDLFGEVATALYRMPDAADDIRVPSTELQAALIDHLCHIWPEKDEGIWEVRGGRQHFVHSKVMAWVGLDRAIKHHEVSDGGGDVKRWRKNRDMLHKEICSKGFNKKLNAFTQSYGSKTLDASCLRLGIVGFLPMDDPRIIGTIDAIQAKLVSNGLVMRYSTAGGGDGLAGGEGAFLACSFWLVINLYLIGREAEAHAMFQRLTALCNDVGLLSEEYDGKARRMLGNFPQALSHIAMAHAAFTLAGKWKPEVSESSS
jgi:GH15 family glucan-1,4-alpha-glucosidase